MLALRLPRTASPFSCRPAMTYGLHSAHYSWWHHNFIRLEGRVWFLFIELWNKFLCIDEKVRPTSLLSPINPLESSQLSLGVGDNRALWSDAWRQILPNYASLARSAASYFTSLQSSRCHGDDCPIKSRRWWSWQREKKTRKQIVTWRWKMAYSRSKTTAPTLNFSHRTRQLVGRSSGEALWGSCRRAIKRNGASLHCGRGFVREALGNLVGIYIRFIDDMLA